jgi:hypothetical protein
MYISMGVSWWISPGTKFSSTNKTDCHDSDIVEILLKVALKTIAITQSLYILYQFIFLVFPHPFFLIFIFDPEPHFQKCFVDQFYWWRKLQYSY